jgi:hypothetical protein
MIYKPMVWLGVVLAVAALFLLARRFAPQERARRRRQRSYGKIVSRRSGPWVRLAVKLKGQKSERER